MSDTPDPKTGSAASDEVKIHPSGNHRFFFTIDPDDPNIAKQIYDQIQAFGADSGA